METFAVTLLLTCVRTTVEVAGVSRHTARTPAQRDEVLIQAVFGDAAPGTGTQGVHVGFVALVGE